MGRCSEVCEESQERERERETERVRRKKIREKRSEKNEDPSAREVIGKSRVFPMCGGSGGLKVASFSVSWSVSKLAGWRAAGLEG